MLQHKNTLQKTALEAQLVKLKEELAGTKRRERKINKRNDKLVQKLAAATNPPFYKSAFARSQSTNNVWKPRQNQGSINNTVHVFSLSQPGDNADKDQEEEEARGMDSSTHTYPPRQTLLQKKYRNKSRKVSFRDFEGCQSIQRRQTSASMQVVTRPTPSINALVSSWNDIRGMQFVDLEKPAEIPAMDAKDLLIRDLRSKLAARDVAIASMEETMMENIKNMQQLHINSSR